MGFLHSKTVIRTFFILGFFLAAFFSLIILLILLNRSVNPTHGKARFLKVQSIDTMKYSRDLALEADKDQLFQNTINRQISDIASTGATHVAIGTPYDEKFYPILKKWVKAARNNKLKVWFRGNFSGWEGWFEFEKITREDHKRKTRDFILNNSEIFEDGDIFTACPECENGGPGDPRVTHDVEGHKKFLIEEYEITKSAFSEIGRKVTSNYNSMNGDVAELVMDKKTTEQLDGIVVIDHYVASPSKLLEDIDKIAQKSGGQVVLGEFGAPIPDIHGQMSEDEQYKYLNNVFSEIIKSKNLIGINYWVNVGGSTQLWDNNGNEKKALNSLKSLYKPRQIYLMITNEVEEAISNARITMEESTWNSDLSGQAQIPLFEDGKDIIIEAPNYKTKKLNSRNLNGDVAVKLEKEHENIFFKSEKLINNFLFFSK